MMLEHVAGCVGDSVGADALGEDSHLLDVLRPEDAARDGYSDPVHHRLGELSAGACAARTVLGVPEAELDRLGKHEQPLGYLRLWRGLAAATGNQREAVCEVVNELIVSVLPPCAGFDEEEDGVNEELGIDAKVWIEPVVRLGDPQTERFAEPHLLLPALGPTLCPWPPTPDFLPFIFAPRCHFAGCVLGSTVIPISRPSNLLRRELVGPMDISALDPVMGLAGEAPVAD
ncbi:MAG TPA: hypothetical protein DCQ04_14960 [Actinobacteria bacterium]|nr:hypothetical protein [Actinomycetota bacterium]